MDKLFKIANFILRGFALLFLIFDIFHFGSFFWISLILVGFLLIIIGGKEVLDGKKLSAWCSMIIGLLVVFLTLVHHFALL